MRRRSAAEATSGSRRARRSSFVARHERDTNAELVLGTPDGLVVEERHHRLAERHALDREQAVPARVQLVDDDVRLAEALERLVVVQPFHEHEVGIEAVAGREHVLRPLTAAGGGRVQDHRARAIGGRRGLDRGDIHARRDELRLGNPADRVVRADDLGAGLLPEGELARATSRGCRSRGSASPTSCGAPAGSGTARTAARA